MINFPLLRLTYLGKTSLFTCLSYKFHMIGSGAAYQEEERFQIKAPQSREG